MNKVSCKFKVKLPWWFYFRLHYWADMQKIAWNNNIMWMVSSWSPKDWKRLPNMYLENSPWLDTITHECTHIAQHLINRTIFLNSHTKLREENKWKLRAVKFIKKLYWVSVHDLKWDDIYQEVWAYPVWDICWIVLSHIIQRNLYVTFYKKKALKNMK